MRNDIAAGFETINTMMENIKPVAVLIHIWQDNTQYCDFTVVSSTITHQEIINGDFYAPYNHRGCARTIPTCQVMEECQRSQSARSLVTQPDQLVLCQPHNLTAPG
jgi:hypothetical protein